MGVFRRVGVLLVLGLCAVAAMSCRSRTHTTANPSRMPQSSVLVIGGIHAAHEKASVYTYERMGELLRTLQPDVLCVEVEHKYVLDGSLAKMPYDFKKHMVPAALALNIPIEGIDWWDESRGAQWETLQQQAWSDPRLAHEAQLNARMFGVLTEYFQQRDFAQIHQPELMDLWASRSAWKYATLLRFPEYAPIVAFEHERNQHMINRVLEIVDRDPSKRVLVAVGIDHKPPIDAALRKRGLRVLDPRDLLFPDAK